MHAFSLTPSAVLFARDRDTAAGPDEQACADTVGAKKALWAVTSAEFVRPPFTVPYGKSVVTVSVASTTEYEKRAGRAHPLSFRIH